MTCAPARAAGRAHRVACRRWDPRRHRTRLTVGTVVPDGGWRTAPSPSANRSARTLSRSPVCMQTDRVDAPREDPPPLVARKRFEELLRVRTDRPSPKPSAPPRRQRTATRARALRAEPRAALAPGEVRGQARREMDASARRRVDDGRVATAQASGRLEERTADLLRRALRTEEAARSEHPARTLAAPPGTSGPGAPEALSTAAGTEPIAAGAGASGPTAVSQGRVERALALVERIEHFVRSGRPSLALTLRGRVAGRLEVQRVGPGAIALRLASSRPPSERELGELRQALEARGLSVRSLEARPLTASAADACSPSP